MIQKFLSAILIAVLITQVSCNKEEGTGGEGSIKGVVILDEIDEISKSTVNTHPAVEQDVYISYGSNLSVDDRVRTGTNGNFEFKYLRDGDYRIYVYSDDLNSSNKLVVEKQFNIKNGKTVTTDTFRVIKLIDYKHGNATIKGFVNIRNYDVIYGNLLDQKPAYDQEVFISMGNQSAVLDRIRTGSDGSFEFRNLINGTYKIYTYSESSKKIDEPITQTFTVANNQIVKTDTFFSKKYLNIDDGTSTIKGKVWVTNFKKDAWTPDRTFPGQDVEVYLIYGNKTDYDIRVRTSFDGNFVFPNLIKGDYTVFVYTAMRDEIGNFVEHELTIDSTKVKISADFTTITLDTLKVLEP